jgi:hypothetical protein
MSEVIYPWNNQQEGFEEALRYISQRKDGIIKSFKTPWFRFNEAGTDGVEWGSIVIVGGRPGTFKTGIKDQIIREAYEINKDETFRVLEFNFEMPKKVSAIRKFSSHIGKSYKHMCSADGKLSQEEYNKCHEYAKIRAKDPVDIIEEACTVNEFRDIIKRYMEAHMKDGVYTNTIVTVDHSILFKLDVYEKTKTDMLYNLGEVMIPLKRQYPIIFLILSQLNRDISRPERNEDGKYGNHVLDTDIWGADGLLHAADMVVGLNRPARQKIMYYGPERYIIEDDNVFVMHFIKCRNGNLGMSFFRADFDKMTIFEADDPPMFKKEKK